MLVMRISRFDRSIRRGNRRGFSLIELLIVVAIILIIAAIAIPKMNTQLMSARETAVINEIGTINKAQIQYYSQFGQYASTLAQLGPPASGTAGPDGADLIPSNLASGDKDGHIFMLSAGEGGYVIQVAPKTYGTDGRRTFYSDQTLQLHQNWSAEPATADSPLIN